MQFDKKYYLNVSSYKYKRECMKLFSTPLKPLTTFSNNEIIESENLCPGGKHCKNYGIILCLEQKIKTLNDTVNQLNKINEYSESISRNITPNKKYEVKRNDSFNNEFCNSFRNSIKKKKINENHRNLTGNITLPQMSEPYRIKPYNSISNEAKIPFKKISNKKHINLTLNNIKNYKNKLNFVPDKNNINEQYFQNKGENVIDKNNINKDILDEDIRIDDKRKILKLYSAIPDAFKDGKEFINKNIKLNSNNLDNCDYDSFKNNQKTEEEKKNKNNDNINIIIKDNNNNKIDNEESNKKNNNNKEEIKNKNIIILPNMKKVKTYKIIEPLKTSKNKRYGFDLLEKKRNIKEDNKLYFRKFKGKIRNSFNSSSNATLSKSFGFYNKTEGNINVFNLRSHYSKSLKNENKINKMKINSFNNFRPLSFTQKPFKIKININQNQIINRNKSDSDKKVKKEKSKSNTSLSNSFELRKFIDELEIENEEENIEKNNIFKEIYNLSLFNSNIIIERLKSLSKEKIDKYCSFIKYCLNHLKDSINLLNKFKLFHNLINRSRNKKYYNYEDKKDLLINEEFTKYKEDAIKIFNCEDIHIFIYDSTLDCLILKGEKTEFKVQKDKDLIGLCFTSGKKISYNDSNNSSLSSFPLLPEKQLLKNTINNLLIYPLKDKYDKIYGVIEAVNKIQDNENNKYNNDNYYSNNKTSFNKNDEILIALISKHLGNFCNYYNIINYKSIYLSYYQARYFLQKIIFTK